MISTQIECPEKEINRSDNTERNTGDFRDRAGQGGRTRQRLYAARKRVRFRHRSSIERRERCAGAGQPKDSRDQEASVLPISERLVDQIEHFIFTLWCLVPGSIQIQTRPTLRKRKGVTQGPKTSKQPHRSERDQTEDCNRGFGFCKLPDGSVVKTVRIFVSSSGDVGAEREKAREIFDRLQTEFSGLLEIVRYYWEHEPMFLHADYQSNIEPPSNFDVFVCLLWGRLGTRLNPAIHRKPAWADWGDVTGTISELLDALDAWHKSKAPKVLVYRRKTEPVIPLNPIKTHDELLAKYRALQAFVESFTKEDEFFVRATNSYTNLEQFEEKFETHMRKVLEGFLSEADLRLRRVPKSWKEGSPFRGLRYFDFEHAPIFFGRTRATEEVLSALREQAANGRTFVLVFGGSGVGKSSLVRAGVLPLLIKPGVIERVGLWRRAILRPSEVNEGDLFDALAAALMRTDDALPEIGSDATSVEKLAVMLRNNPEGVDIAIKGALSQAANKIRIEKKLEEQPRAKFALVVDQLEELFTVERLAAQREAFLRAIEGLARSETGNVWVLATLRSDFYSRCEESPILMELKKGTGQYHLQPPNEIQLGQMIRMPATAAGLEFEKNERTGERLDDLVRDAAVKNPGALPLLEFALEELYEQRDQEQGLLTLDAYRKLGGVEGALAKRAEDSFQNASKAARDSFDLVFRQLVTIGTAETDLALRRRARKRDIENKPGAQELIERLVEDRLLLIDRVQDGTVIVTLAHEAILIHWPRLQRWIQENRAFLEARKQLDLELTDYERHGRKRSYLLASKPHLRSARRLLRTHRHDLNEAERVFIRKSTRRAHLRSARVWLAVAAASTLLLVIAAVVVINWSFSQNGERPTGWVPITLNYVYGSILERVGKKDRALALYEREFRQSSKLNIPVTTRLALNIYPFKKILDLVLETGAPLPEDQEFNQVVGWAKEFAQSGIWGKDSDVPILNMTKEFGDAFQKRKRWSDAGAMYEEAAVWLRKLALRDPKDQKALKTLRDALTAASWCMLNANEFGKARRDLEETLQTITTLEKIGGEKATLQQLAGIHSDLSRACSAIGDDESAANYLQTYIQIEKSIVAQNPKDPLVERNNLSSALCTFGNVERILDRYTEAEAAVDEGLKLARQDFADAPNGENVKATLINALVAEAALHARTIDTGLLQRALNFCTEALQLNPNDVLALTRRGFYNACLGKKEESQSDFQHALRIDPNDVDALRMFGWACIDLGDPTQAMEQWRAIEEMFNRSGKERPVEILTALAAQSWLRGNKEEAISRYRRAAVLDANLKDPNSFTNWPRPSKELLETIIRAATPFVGSEHGAQNVIIQDDWMTSAEYQHALDKSIAHKLYPVTVQGRVNFGRDEFRSSWVQCPDQCGFGEYYGLTPEQYEQYNARYSGQGYHVATVSKFINAKRQERYQAVWSRNCGSVADLSANH